MPMTSATRFSAKAIVPVKARTIVPNNADRMLRKAGHPE
jgi:hypothetical protein